MKMLLLLIYFLGVADAHAEGEGFLSALKNYKKTFQELASPARHLEASDGLIEKWSQLDALNKARWADKMALVHYRKAQIYTNSGNYSLAAQELTEEIKIQTTFGGQIEHSTKKSDTFFAELVELQALVTAETGRDPLAGQVSYHFEKDGNGFTAARLELYDDVAGITVPDVGDDDALALVYRLNRQGGKFVATAPKWLVVPKGELPDVLEQATREVVFEADGRMTVHNLKVQASPSPKVDSSATDNTASPQVPSHVQPPAPKKPTDQKSAPSIPVGESPASTRWPLEAVVIVAVLGFLWLLLKKRK